MRVVPYLTRTEERLPVCLANDFSWVCTGRKPSKEDLPRNPPNPCTGVKNLVRGCGIPNKILDAVSGVCLPAKEIRRGIEISVPGFEYIVTIVAKF